MCCVCEVPCAAVLRAADTCLWVRLSTCARSRPLHSPPLVVAYWSSLMPSVAARSVCFSSGVCVCPSADQSLLSVFSGSAECRCRWPRPVPSSSLAGQVGSSGHGPGRPARPAGAECCGTPGRGAERASQPPAEARRPRLRPPSVLRHLVLLLLLSSVFRIAGECSAPRPLHASQTASVMFPTWRSNEAG